MGRVYYEASSMGNTQIITPLKNGKKDEIVWTFNNYPGSFQVVNIVYLKA